MTDLEILEQYAKEFCDVLNAYNPHKTYLCFKSLSDDGYAIRAGLDLLFKVNLIGPEKHIQIVDERMENIFMDSAPFEKNKEVRCED